MAQQIINVGATPNDGTGDPIRTAFIKSNNNFSQLYSRAQVSPPTSLTGEIGDEAGMYAYDSTYFYYCFAEYDGSSIIWAQVTQVGNISTNQINSGNSNVIISGSGGNVVMGINGVTNAAVFTATTANLVGNVVSGGYFIGDGSLLTGLPASYANANVTAYAESGWGGNIVPSANATYNLGSATNQWKSLYVSNTTIYLGNVPLGIGAGNVLTVNGNAVLTNGSDANISTSGNVTVGAILTDDYYFANGSPFVTPTSYGNANVVANLAALASNPISTTGTITAGNLNAVNLVINNISSDDSTFVTIQDGLDVTGNVVADYFIGDGSQLTNLPGGGANTGNVTFSGETVIGTGTSNTVSGLYLAPDPGSLANNLYLRVRGNIIDEPTHIHFDTGNNAYYNQFIGDDNKYIQLANTGNIVINSNDGAGNTAQWTFDTAGNVTIPGNIVGLATIDIDNRATGNGADIQLYSADDILLQARDRSAGSTSEGGDINIFAGDSAEDSDSSGGDIVIEGGRGGNSNVDFGGSGGFVRVEAGQGGDAIGASFSALGGGNLTLRAGDAGTNNGNIDLGNSGGDVIINAGDSTGNGVNGGTIYLTSGAADASALAGSVVIQAGGTWTFDGYGNLTLPNGAVVKDTSGDSVAFGQSAGLTSQAQHAVAIGINAGRLYQGEDSVAIGYNAGYQDQQRGVAIGWNAGQGGTLYRSVSDAQGGSGPVTTYNPVQAPNVSRLYVTSTADIVTSQRVFGNNIQANTVVTAVYPGEDRVDIAPDYTAAMSPGDTLTFVGLVIGVNDASNVVVGMRATGDDIPTNTFVQSTGCSVVTLSQYPTAPLIDGASIVFTVGQGFGATAIGYQAGSTFQDDNAVAVGRQAGYNNQGVQAVAVGGLAGYSNQSANAVAVGYGAGQSTQSINAVAVGYLAGYNTQGNRAVAIGEDAGYNTQGEDAVAVGQRAGFASQQPFAVAIGNSAGYSGQLDRAVAIGYGTGAISQGVRAVAIGANAASYAQGSSAVAIGELAGNTSQGINSVAIGFSAAGNVQGNSAVAVGDSAGYDNQGILAVAIGQDAGNDNQGNTSVAIGASAGYTDQGLAAIAIGRLAGYDSQGTDAIAIGPSAGNVSQGQFAVAMGFEAGNSIQGTNAVAIGASAGAIAQGIESVAIGDLAGEVNQGEYSVAIGDLAGQTTQGNAAVAVGAGAGTNNQGVHGVAIGTDAGATTQANRAVAIGYLAGSIAQGTESVAIGYYAGELNQGNNSIIINATGEGLQQTTANTFTVAPIRNDVANIGEVVFYNTTSKEITYGNTISVAGNITCGTLIGNVTGAGAGVPTISSASNLVLSAIGNVQVTGNYLNMTGNISATSNILTGGLISATGNVTGGNILTDGLISATGNVSGGNLNVTGNIVDTGALSVITGSNGNIALAPNGTGIVTVSTDISVTGNIIGNTAGFAIGYRDIPQVAFTANATIAATDAGKHYYSTLSTANALTIANNTSVSWTVGTAITVVNRGSGNIIITQGSGVSLYLAGNSTPANRTVTTYGMATLLNVAANVWMINGTGVS